MKRTLFLLLFTITLAAEPRRFIIEYAGPGNARIQSDAARIAVVHREFTRVFHGAAVELREGESVDALARLPYVAAVYPDREVVAFSDPVPSVAGGHTLPRAAQGTGNGIVVAVLDTGIDGTHPALAGKVIGGYDFINDDADPMDDHGHGTHVARIIAAKSNVVTGVAPGVRLLAMKVLNAQGRGTTSAVIAALERALDPNGDGDTSDHAAIANLSLGDRGTPTDPLSKAVDNAVASGMIVCVAAGNEETFHRIGSPASAADAITVGASTVEDGVPSVAFFTSRGPATGSGAIKPDLLAPGRDIFSTSLNHGYATLSGTSMSTPYVSGLAALLLEEHPGWSPRRVKAALVATAIPVAEEEVMTQGSGIADLASARSNTLVPSITQLAFGLDGAIGGSWSSSRRFTVRNEAASSRTLHASVAGTSAAVRIDVQPAELTLAPGESREIEVTVAADNTLLGKPRSRSFSFGGTVSLTTDGEAIRLPWALVRAGRATITNDGDVPAVSWRSETPRDASAVAIGKGTELLLEPGLYDFVITAPDGDALRLVIAEGRQITGDVPLAITAADAPHEIRVAGVDERGETFSDGDGVSTLRSLLLRLLLPDGQSMPLPDVDGRVVHASAFSERYGVLATESFVNRAAARIHVAQYAPLHGASGNRLLQVSPADYASRELVLHFPPGERREVVVMPRDWSRDPRNFRTEPPSLRFSAGDPVWHGTLLMTKEVDDDVAGAVQLALYTAADEHAAATLMTPPIRRNDRGFFATWGYADEAIPSGAASDEAMTFGRGVIHLPNVIEATADAFFGDADVHGDRGDRRRIDTAAGTIRLLDASGKEIGSSPVTPGFFFLPMPGSGRFTAEITFPSFAIDDRTGAARLTASFDSTSHVALPNITTLAVLDGAGRHVTRLPANGNGAVVFSAAGYDAGRYRRIAENATKVQVRRRDAGTWMEVPAVIAGNDENDDLRPPAGLVFRTDLRDALRSGPGEYELRIEIADVDGNTVRWEVGPAFVVAGSNAQQRRRAA